METGLQRSSSRLYDLHDHAIGLNERLAIAGHAEQIAHEVVVLGVEWQAAAVKV